MNAENLDTFSIFRGMHTSLLTVLSNTFLETSLFTYIRTAISDLPTSMPQEVSALVMNKVTACLVSDTNL